MSIRPGTQFGRYEMVSRLGRGGMAETWRARLLGAAGVTKPVLIKSVLPEYSSDQAFTSMFVSEARISATLSHGNIAQVYDFGRLDGEYFLAMEFVDGQPLHRIIKRALHFGMDSIPATLAAFIAIEMCRGLHYAHTRTDGSGKSLGIVHRDISPDNVIVSYEGQVKIVDFGIAKARELRGFNTEPGVVKGKFLFFSPEQAHGEEVDARTDVWATGVVLYEMLCGRLPVEGQAYVALPKLVKGEFPRPGMINPDVPAELNAIVMKALAVRREDRFESSHAFGDALAGFLYSTAPRFSAMSLAHFVQELFRDDLAAEGRSVQVPHSFLEQFAQWRGAPPPTAPMAVQYVRTEPLPQPAAVVTTRVAPALATPAAVPSRAMLMGAAAIGAALMGIVLGVGFVVVQELTRPPQGPVVPPAPEPITRPQPVPPPPVPPPPEAPLRTPQVEPRPARGSAEYPVDNILLEARRDVVDVTRVAERLPLKPEVSYNISEPNPPPDAPPLFFWLAGPGLRAEEAVGALVGQARSIKGATGLKVFALAPLLPGQPRREVLVENKDSGDSGRLVLSPAEEASTEQAFQLTRLDETATYWADALPAAESAYTRGEEGGPTGLVACARLSNPGFVPSGMEPGPFNRQQQFVLKTGTFARVEGATGLLCGFIDNNPSDNRGSVRLRLLKVDPVAAKAAHDEAVKHFRARQFAQAVTRAGKCLELEPENAKCHMLMGACYARLNNQELAAKHYREFLRLAPDDRTSAKIRELLRSYDRQNSR